MNKLPCILCDIDGTIAIRGDRGPHDLSLVVEDAPRPNTQRLLQCLETNFYVVYLSGRQELCRGATKYWLAAHHFPNYHGLFMRKDGDNRADEIIKAELYDLHIEPKYQVMAILDDRDKVVKMWRQKGLLCLQVDYGDF